MKRTTAIGNIKTVHNQHPDMTKHNTAGVDRLPQASGPLRQSDPWNYKVYDALPGTWSRTTLLQA